MYVWLVEINSTLHSNKFDESWGTYHITAENFDAATKRAKELIAEELKDHKDFVFEVVTLKRQDKLT